MLGLEIKSPLDGLYIEAPHEVSAFQRWEDKAKAEKTRTSLCSLNKPNVYFLTIYRVSTNTSDASGMENVGFGLEQKLWVSNFFSSRAKN